ncbi:helix-turn-helix domain-containing protein [Paracoccus aerodenitrificans]|uniref:helix-turn-helix domain-containing protein n=1 Tax=Paracoccus aerodenitrificans TaxID=3017781 RepID=UPI0022F1237B|nr:helix-turn-helix transcriptional regulator [Paracoccus aerodenitrificans]WBU64566.1 helix-turn-helix transcriptional regulator [Paracoccus aerodenitrificans]
MFKLTKDVGTEEAREEHERLEGERIDKELWFHESGPEKALHENLRDYRIKHQLTKQQMSDLLEVTPRTYYAYEEGLRPVPSPAIVRLAILTGGDLNEILLGRPAPFAHQTTAQTVINEAIVVMKYLAITYPEMGIEDRYQVARFHATTSFGEFPRMHPGTIRDCVRIVTRYRFHPEDIPAPPNHEAYGDDHERWELDMAAWQKAIDEDFPDG